MSTLKLVEDCSMRSSRNSVCQPFESSYTMATLFPDSSVISASVRHASGLAAIIVSNISFAPLLPMHLIPPLCLALSDSTSQWTCSRVLGKVKLHGRFDQSFG